MKKLYASYRAALDSLRLRLLVGTLVWILVSIIAAGWGLSSLFQRHISTQFQAELKTHLDQLTAALAINSEGRPSVPLPLSDPRFDQPYSRLYWQIDQVQDRTRPAVAGLLRSRSLWDAVLTAPASVLADEPEKIYSISGPDGHALSVLERIIHPNEDAAPVLRLMIAADQRLMAEPIERFTRMLVLSLGVLALGLMLAAIVQVLTGLRPLSQLRRKLVAVRDGRERRIEGHFPTEVQPLVDDFNGVLSINAEIVNRARTQAGNLAHSVKTPLAILANAAEREDTPLARLVLEQVATARRQVDYHLARARAAAAVQASGLRTVVRPPLEALVRVMGRLHAERGLDVALDCASEEIAFRGDEQDLQEMLGNLLDNACKWAASRVVVNVATEGASLLFTVDDDGKGLSASECEKVFRRGVRADEQAAGSGLGLAIVRDLALLYGGGVHAENSPAGGLRMVLRLPSA